MTIGVGVGVGVDDFHALESFIQDSDSGLTGFSTVARRWSCSGTPSCQKAIGRAVCRAPVSGAIAANIGSHRILHDRFEIAKLLGVASGFSGDELVLSSLPPILGTIHRSRSAVARALRFITAQTVVASWNTLTGLSAVARRN